MAERREQILAVLASTVLPVWKHFVITLLLTIALVLTVERFIAVIDQPIAVIEVQGANEYVPEAVIHERLADQLGVGFWQVDVQAMRTRLLEDEWLVNAQVRKQWPGRLVVTIEVHQPVAYWNQDHLLSTSGTIFRPQSIPDLALAQLSGPADSQWSLWERYLSLQGALESHGLGLAGIELSERGALSLILTDGVTLNLGRHEPESRLQRYLDVFEQAFAGRMDAVDAVDLRYTNGFAVSWNHAGEDSQQ